MTSEQAGGGQRKVVPVGEGLFHMPESPNDKAYLIGSKCSNCGYISYPAEKVCPNCVRDDTVTEVHMSGKATLQRYTVAQRGPSGFPVPYIQSYVKLDEGPIIYSLIAGVEQKEGVLQPGQKLEMVIEKIRTDAAGDDIVGYKFKPV
ncbi:MAG: OB-fold domain-containing protein [Dehalococcoidales bacterium]|nr:OB-fold domain-containing protein [Dehalococcoidales bacterium]